MTPRVFVQYWVEDLSNWVNVPNKRVVLELLKDGQAVEMKETPLPEDGFRFWSLDVDALSSVNFIRPMNDPVPMEAKTISQEIIDDLAKAGLKVGKDGSIEKEL